MGDAFQRGEVLGFLLGLEAVDLDVRYDHGDEVAEELQLVDFLLDLREGCLSGGACTPSIYDCNLASASCFDPFWKMDLSVVLPI